MELTDRKNIYFLGIGGIGMSALARYFHSSGYNVSGYDRTSSAITDQLSHEGIQVFFEDKLSSVKDEFIQNPIQTIVIYTPAIPDQNQLMNYFKDQNYKMYKRSEMLGEVTRNTINLSVAGTHGKTTTSSIVASIFQQSQFSFSAFLGGISANLNSNYYRQDNGGDDYSITEADEFDRSFLYLKPTYSVITSTDTDHLDIYGSKEDLEQSYIEYSKLISNTDHLFYAKNKAENIGGVSYSVDDHKADFYTSVRAQNSVGTHFDICNHLGEIYIHDLFISLPGIHNLENALGAALMCRKAGIGVDAIRKGLKDFKGIKRRFQYVIDRNDLLYIDDYAHHPSELKAIISSVRSLYPKRKITAIFQPHLYTRTQDFMSDFAVELSRVDHLILLPIYPARELPIEGVTSEALLQKIDHDDATCILQEQVINDLRSRDLDILLTLGAGDIDQLVEPIYENYGK
ncbi:MAG: UDP-N-acetylmuramate--L-alanine ligase [Bacteroidia bacterium]|nr:UDP-N-acetylmuramate--L-alanine ligase [Bacteroidia bacterium]